MSRQIKIKTESDNSALINVSDNWYDNNVVKLIYTYGDDLIDFSFKHRDKAYYETDTLIDNTKWTELITNPEIIVGATDEDMNEYNTMIFNALIQLQVTNSTCTTIKNDFFHNPNTEDGLLDILDPNIMSYVSETTIALYNAVFALAGGEEGQEQIAWLLLSMFANMVVVPELIYNQTKLNVRKMLITAYRIAVDNIYYTFMYDLDDPDHHVYYTDDELMAVVTPYIDSKYKVVKATPISTILSDAETEALGKKYPELTFSGGVESTLTDQMSSMYSNIQWQFFTTKQEVPSEIVRDFSLSGTGRIIGGVKVNGEYVDNNAKPIDSSMHVSTYAPYDWNATGNGTPDENVLKVDILDSCNNVKESIVNKSAKIDGSDHSEELPNTNDIDVSEMQPGDKLSIKTVVGRTTCLSGDTLITMYDRTTRRLDEIQPGDLILAYHDGKYVLDTVKFTDSIANKTGNDLIIYYFENCTPLKVIKDHRLFNCRLNRYTHLSEFQLGDETLNLRGEKVKLLKRDYYNVPTQHYTIFTNRYNNYFANSMLAGNIFSNMKTNIIFKLYYYLKLKWEMKSYERQNNRKNGATNNR